MIVEPIDDVTQESDEHALHEKDVYLLDRTRVTDRRSKIADELDKALLTYPAALTGVAITFLSSHLKGIPAVLMFAFGCLSLAGSSLLTIFSMRVAMKSYSRGVEILDDDRRAAFGQKREHPDRDNCYAGQPEKLTDWAIGLCVMGIVLLVASMSISNSSLGSPTMSDNKGKSQFTESATGRPVTNQLQAQTKPGSGGTPQPNPQTKSESNVSRPVTQPTTGTGGSGSGAGSTPKK